MKVNREDFLDALTKIKPGLSEKAIIEQTDHFIFEKNFVRSYNDEIAISFPFKSGFSAAIKASEFYSLVSKIGAKEIDLTVKDGKMSIAADKIKSQMVVASEIKCPDVEIKSQEWLKLPKKFSEAIYFCSFSSGRGTSSSSIVLACLWVKDDCVYSSDRFQASKYKIGGKLPELLFLASPARELSKYSPTHYLLRDDAWIHFKNDDGVIFSIRIVDGEYPEGILGMFDVKGDSITIPGGLREAVDRAKIFTQEVVESSGLVEIKVNKLGKLTCRGEGVLGWVEEEFKIGYKKKDFVVRAPSDLLGEVLSRAKEMKVSETKLYFSGQDFEHVISLI